jgi:hypothetical protein
MKIRWGGPYSNFMMYLSPHRPKKETKKKTKLKKKFTPTKDRSLPHLQGPKFTEDGADRWYRRRGQNLRGFVAFFAAYGCPCLHVAVQHSLTRLKARTFWIKRNKLTSNKLRQLKTTIQQDIEDNPSKSNIFEDMVTWWGYYLHNFMELILPVNIDNECDSPSLLLRL